jgi:hypothetical protein
MPAKYSKSPALESTTEVTVTLDGLPELAPVYAFSTTPLAPTNWSQIMPMPLVAAFGVIVAVQFPLGAVTPDAGHIQTAQYA